MKPEQGKVYVSQIDPQIRLYVEAVHDIEADEEQGEPETFHVEACYEQDRDDPGAPGIEFAGDEWEDFDKLHRLTASS